MIEIRPARFGRHVTRTVAADEIVRVELRLPASTAALLFEHAHLSERTISSVAGQAIREHAHHNPPALPADPAMPDDEPSEGVADM